jgi:hypothetical protein
MQQWAVLEFMLNMTSQFFAIPIVTTHFVNATEKRLSPSSCPLAFRVESSTTPLLLFQNIIWNDGTTPFFLFKFSNES